MGKPGVFAEPSISQAKAHQPSRERAFALDRGISPLPHTIRMWTGSVTGGLAALALCFIGAHSQAQNPPTRTIHVFVALADNEHQGIVPVPARIGNGMDPEHNLYWGAAAGVKTFFTRSADWSLGQCVEKPKPAILERCIFKHRRRDVYLVADAYRGPRDLGRRFSIFSARLREPMPSQSLDRERMRPRSRPAADRIWSPTWGTMA
jgi:hypothetical protein